MENKDLKNNIEKVTNPTQKLESVRKFFVDLVKDILDLSKGVDKMATIKEIKSKQSMSGANAWMLICSIMIASIGLNLDSQAVIIGAMLISPLMSPILGIGLGVAINDRAALYHALLNFGAAIVIALLTSYIYFILTPLDNLTPQIEARTMPTFLDILIAVFGGIAGIVSIARKDISTTLPGVAIATALMPPLCVTGFGLANGEWSITYKSFYLFFLNSFFVAFVTYVIIRRMHFPFKVYSSPKDRRKNIIFVSIFSIMMIIPSVLIFRTVFLGYQKKLMLKEFISETFTGNDINYLDGYRLFPPEDPNKLILKVYGTHINKTHIPEYQEKLSQYGFDYINEIEIISTSEIDLNKMNQMRAEISGIDEKLTAQLEELLAEREAQILILNEMEKQSRFGSLDTMKFRKVSKDLQTFYPNVSKVGMAMTQYINNKDSIVQLPTVLIQGTKLTNEQTKAINSYMLREYGLDTVKIVIE